MIFALLAVVAAVELAVRFALPFDLTRVLVVEAVLFPLAGVACVALIRRRPSQSSLGRTLQLLLAAAFFLGGLRALVWVAGGSVMAANVTTVAAAVVAWAWYRVRRRPDAS